MLLPAIAVLIVAGIAVATAAGSWMAFAFPMLIPLVYIGIDEGWWGSHGELGEAWQSAAVFLTVVGLLTLLSRGFSRNWSRCGAVGPSGLERSSGGRTLRRGGHLAWRAVVPVEDDG